MAFLRKNKIFTVLFILTVLSCFIGLLIPSILTNEHKVTIIQNIASLEENIEKGSLFGNFSILWRNLFTINMIWILGISIIGIPILLVYYILNETLLFTELSFLLIHLKGFHRFWIPIYLFPSFVQNLLYFILIYYALHYSFFLIRILFFKEDASRIRVVTRRYLKILGIILIGAILNSFCEIFLIPKILKFFI